MMTTLYVAQYSYIGFLVPGALAVNFSLCLWLREQSKARRGSHWMGLWLSACDSAELSLCVIPSTAVVVLPRVRMTGLGVT